MFPVPPVTASAIVVFVGFVATVSDLRTRRIPNSLTASTALAGLIAAAAGVTPVPLAAAIAAVLVGFALMLPGYALGATGAGDVKLMAAFGAWLGPDVVVIAFLFTAVAGGALAVAVAIARGRVRPMLEGTARLAAGPSQARAFCSGRDGSHRFAYGPAIAVGAAAAVWWC